MLALVVFGVALRAWIMASVIGVLDSDEAVAGLMARRLLEGEPSAFFWGQSYGGSLEPAVAAPLFAVLGSSALALKLVSVGLSVIAALLVWRVGLRTVGPKIAAFGAALFWASPFAFVFLSTKERGFYQVTMIAGLVMLLCVLRLVERPAVGDAAALGLAAGIGLWSSPQVMYLALPAGLWLVARRPSRLVLLWAMIPAFLIGLFPALLFNARNDFSSLDVPALAITSTYTERLRLFFTHGFAFALGARIPYTREWTLSVVGMLVTATAGAAVLVLCVLAVKRIRYEPARHEVLLLCVVLYPFIFAVSPYSVYVREPRYLYFLAPALALLVPVLAKRFLPVIGVVAVVLAVVSMQTLVTWPERTINYELSTEDPTKVVAELDATGTTRAFSDYWLAYEIVFHTKERILVAPLTVDRQPAWTAEVLLEPSPPWLLYAGSPEDQAFLRVATSKGITHTQVRIGRTVIYRPSGLIVPTDILGAL